MSLFKKNITKKIITLGLFLVIILNIFTPTFVKADNTREVYFVWGDSNNKYHYHKLTVKKNEDIGGSIKINTTYVPLSDIVDDNDHTTKFDLSYQTITINGVKESSWYVCDKDDFERINLNNFKTAEALLADHVQESAINPLRSPYGNNSLYHDGDHDFRLIIYNDKVGAYSAVKYGVTNETRYIPAFWDPVFYPNTYDITGTTKENPQIIESYILEDTISLSNSEYSAKFISIKPLNVPEKAVTIKNADNMFFIKFNSNAYDRVVFELKDENNKTYYVMIARIALQVFDNFAPDISDANSKIIVLLYYPNDKNYSDYEVIANVEYKNGTEAVKKLTVRDIIEKYWDLDKDKEVSINRGKAWDGGTNLKFSQYEIGNGKSIKTIKFFVNNAGSSHRVFKGTFSGSANGTVYDISARRLVYTEGVE